MTTKDQKNGPFMTIGHFEERRQFSQFFPRENFYGPVIIELRVYNCWPVLFVLIFAF
jgi:hypothetical protein